MATRLGGWMLAGAWVLLAVGLTGAKQPGDTTLASEGTATLQPRPTALRMEVELRAYGSTVKLALERLGARRERAVETLEKLGVEKGRIVLGPPEVVQVAPLDFSPGGSRVAGRPRGFFAVPPEGMTMATKARGRAVQGVRRAETRLVAEPRRPENRLFSASRKVTADWPLAEPDLERLLVVAHQLREKIEAADVAGVGQAQDLSALERELLDRARQQQADPNLPAPLPMAALDGPIGPSFLYVARITPQQRSKLQSEAFAVAKTRAASLAEVAGARLGRLYDLTSQFEVAAPGDEYEVSDYDYAYEPPAGRLASLAVSAGEETSGRTVGSLRFSVLVTATFRLE